MNPPLHALRTVLTFFFRISCILLLITWHFFFKFIPVIIIVTFWLDSYVKISQLKLHKYYYYIKFLLYVELLC